MPDDLGQEPDPQPAAPLDADDAAPATGPARLKGTQSLERLRDRVRLAARELERLRQENRTLRERIDQLERRPTFDPEATVLAFDEDPEALRAKIERFVEAIDAYLAQENA